MVRTQIQAIKERSVEHGVSVAEYIGLGIRNAFTLDPHFAGQGFNVLLGPASA